MEIEPEIVWKLNKKKNMEFEQEKTWKLNKKNGWNSTLKGHDIYLESPTIEPA